MSSHHWPRVHHVTCKYLCILLCLAAKKIFRSCVNETTLFFFLWSLLLKMADCFQSISFKKQIRWSNDKTIIEFGYRNLSWLVSVSFASGSARRWQIRIVCSTLSNNCLLFWIELSVTMIDVEASNFCSYLCFKISVSLCFYEVGYTLWHLLSKLVLFDL